MPEDLNSNESLKKKTVKGVVWSAIERFSAQAITFLVTIVMARILTPSDYGLVGMVFIFIYIAQSLVESGFLQALIRKQDRNETDNSTAFFFNIVVGFAIYALLWFGAPLIADFYDEPILVDITRWICIAIIFNSVVVVQRAIFTIELNFKTQAKASITSSVVSGVVGIYMAYSSFGVWSIVAFQLVNIGLNSILLWIFSKWRPSWIFSWTSFKELFGFGFKLAVSGLLHTLYISGYNLVIGKVFKAADLGFYTRAEQFARFLSQNVGLILQRVTYPVLCKFQNDREGLAAAFIKMLRLSSFLIFALMMGMMGIAKPLVFVLLGEKWLFSADLLVILCFAFMWYPVNSLNLNVLIVKGRSDFYLKLEIVKKIIFIAILAAMIPLGLIAMCWGLVICALLEIIINSYYTNRFIGISTWNQIFNILPSFLYAASMGAVVWISTNLFDNYYVQFFVGISVGVIYFFIVTKITHSSDLREMMGLVKLKKAL